MGITDDERETVFEIVLPIELKNNNTGRGHAWYQSANTRKRMESQLRSLGLQREPFETCVKLRLTRILGPRQRLWDEGSIGRGNGKELLDSLVAVGWFHDDGPKWIRPVDWRQDETQRDNGPAVRIEVMQ